MDSSNQKSNWSVSEEETFPSSPEVVWIVLEAFIVLAFISGSILNSILLIVFFRRRGFRTSISNRFLINLVLANLFTLFCFAPFVLFDAIWTNSGDQSTGQHRLALHLAVLHPLHYHRRINSNKCLVLCLASWLAAFVLGILEVSIADSASSASGSFFKICQRGLAEQDETRMTGIAMTIFLVSVIFVIPFITLSVIYFRVFTAARDNSIRTRRNSSCSTTVDGVKNGNNNNNLKSTTYISGNYLTVTTPNDLHRSPSVKSTGSNLSQFANSLRASMRHRVSYASAMLIHHREESRAATVTILVLASLVTCWSPLVTVSCLHVFGIELNSGFSWIKFLALLFVLSNTVTTPILYAYRSARVRREIKRGLGLVKGPHHRDLWPQSSLYNKRARMRRLKSFSCPQLLISSDCDAAAAGFPAKPTRLTRPNGKTTRFMLTKVHEQPFDSMEKDLESSEVTPMVDPVQITVCSERIYTATSKVHNDDL